VRALLPACLTGAHEHPEWRPQTSAQAHQLAGADDKTPRRCPTRTGSRVVSAAPWPRPGPGERDQECELGCDGPPRIDSSRRPEPGSLPSSCHRKGPLQRCWPLHSFGKCFAIRHPPAPVACDRIVNLRNEPVPCRPRRTSAPGPRRDPWRHAAQRPRRGSQQAVPAAARCSALRTSAGLQHAARPCSRRACCGNGRAFAKPMRALEMGRCWGFSSRCVSMA
jgi:hypothetical protein